MTWPILTDYDAEVQSPHICFADEELKKGKLLLTPLGLPRPFSGTFAVVYSITCGSRTYAVKCFQHEFLDQQHRYAEISKHLARAGLPYTVGFEFIPQGIRVRGNWFPLLKMEWVQGELLNEYIGRNLKNPSALFDLSQRWLQMIQALQSAGIAHGDLQHGNVLVVDGDLRLIDYDGMFVPGLAGEVSHEIGHRNYQHPNRTSSDFALYTDHFAAWVIYISLLLLSIDSKLWQKVEKAGDESILFRGEDFKEPSKSPTFVMLMGHIDPRVQSLATFFQGLLYLNPKQVQVLDPEILQSTLSLVHHPSRKGDGSWLATHIGSPEVSGASISSTQAVWLKDHTTQASIKSDSGSLISAASTHHHFERQSSATWVLDFISTPGSTTLQTFGVQRSVPRFTAWLSAILFAVLSALCFLSTSFPLYYLLFATIALFFINRWLLISSYQKDPIVVEMTAILEREEEKQHLLTSLEKIIRDQEEKKSRLSTIESSKSGSLTKQATDIQNKERQERERVEKSLRQEIDSINSRRLGLNNNEALALRQAQDKIGLEISGLNRQVVASAEAESENLAKALKMVQTLFLDSYLKQHRIVDASVSGLGEKLKGRLLDNGIHTAAEAVWGRIMRVEGIGPNKANAIDRWRESLVTTAKAKMPQSLSSSDMDNIRAKYLSQRSQAQIQIDNLKRRLVCEENTIRDQHAQVRQTIEVQLSTAQTKARNELKRIADGHSNELSFLSQELQRVAAEYDNEYRQIDESAAQVRKRLSECHWQLAKARRELASFKNISFREYVRMVLF